MGLRYYLTNDFGGGGTNVSRFFVYMDLLSGSSLGLLLNYYYLENKFPKKVGFNQKELGQLDQYLSIQEFIHAMKALFASKGQVSAAYAVQKGEYLPVVMIDSGSGNILRDDSEMIAKNFDRLSDHYATIVGGYHKFCSERKADVVIAVDVASKYTYKGGENTDEAYLNLKNRLKIDVQANTDLLELAIKDRQQHQYIQALYAPIHGVNLETYMQHFQAVLELERKYKYSFDGFAVGGIGPIRSIERCVLIGKLIMRMREILDQQDRHVPIHVLGAGGIKNLIALTYAGADSFDCHTPWRRASDDQAKFLVPLLNTNLETLGNDQVYEFVSLTKLSDSMGCDCPICKLYPITRIKPLYSGSPEDNYFAKILIFMHAMWQYEFLLKKLQQIYSCEDSATKLCEFVNSIKDARYQRHVKSCLRVLTKQ